jgi:hypothetical protein
MLSSITPLGERGRKSRWGVTVSVFVLGSTTAGALCGVAAGALGAAALGRPPAGAATLVLAAALVAGGALELRLAGLALPTVRRQVQEAWLRTYRGWVYGLGFGAQLGAGVVTIVVSSAIYVTFLACALSASPASGALLGALFGAARGLTLLPAAVARDRRGLMRLHVGLLRWRSPVHRAALVAQGGLALLGLVLVFG